MTVPAIAYLKWANVLPPPEPVSERALPVPNGHYARIKAADALFALEDLTVDWGAPWSMDLGKLRSELAKRRVALNELRSALQLPCYTPVFDPANAEEACPSYGSAYTLFWCEARVAQVDGRHADAMSASLDAIELGVKLGRGGPLLNCILGQSSEMGVDAGQRVVGSLTAAEARAAGRRLDRILNQLPTLAAALEEQRPVELARLRGWLLSPRASPQTALGSPFTLPPADAVWSEIVRWLYPKPWTYQQMGHYYRRLAEVARQPYRSRRFPPSGLESDPMSGGAPVLVFNYDVGDSPEGVSFHFAENETLLRLLRIRLALQEYHQSHRRWPDSLPEAVAHLDRDAVMDPFSSATLRYRRQGDGFALYSVGPDLKDDGGKPIASRWANCDSRGDIVSGPLYPIRNVEAPP